MRHSRPRMFGVVVFAIAVMGLVASTPIAACPSCVGPTLTLSEQYANAEAAVLAQWISGEMSTRERLGSTTYEIMQVAKTPSKSSDSGKVIEKGKHITLERYRPGKKGELVLMLGSRFRSDGLEWSSPLDVTVTSYNYIVESPALAIKTEQRLAYYLKFLEHPDRTIAADAYGEFANAPYESIVPLTKQFPRESLRRWLVSPDVPVSRTGLYGIMLGLCGNEEDAELLRAKIMDFSQEFRLGTDGVIFGYVMLAGEPGLHEIEKSLLQNKDVPVIETYAGMQALRHLWTYSDRRISRERLKASMRLLLGRPDVADFVISDLGRWKDWSIQAHLMELYGADEYNIPSMKRAIIRYMIASTKDVPAGGGEKPPKHAVDGARYLEELRNKDAKMVNDAERLFYLQ